MDAGMPSESVSSNLAELTADIVSAYVAKNSVRPEDLTALINTVHSALSGVGSGTGAGTAAEAKREPVVSIKKSITPDFLISLFDGKKYKTLKRHLRTSYNMTPEQYREYFNWARLSDGGPELPGGADRDAGHRKAGEALLEPTSVVVHAANWKSQPVKVVPFQASQPPFRHPAH